MTINAMVTGSNGHLGSNLTRELASRKYDVRATVRDASDIAKTAHLAEAGINDVVSLNVRDGEQFSAVSEGIDVLFHCAATYRYYTGSKTADDEMMRDSIEGACAAIHAAHANKIRKVILTSSAVTQPLVEPGGRVVTEEDWRTDLRLPYFRAKTLAERAAWKFAEQLGVNLVTILPGVIIGPGFLKRTTSTDLIEGIMLGSMRFGSPNTNLPFVDVRDVVHAHILAAEIVCTGRFTVVNDDLPYLIEITRIMNAIDPSVPAAKWNLPDVALKFGPAIEWVSNRILGTPRILTADLIGSMAGKEWTMSNTRAKKVLGWQQRVSLQRSLAETMEGLRRLRAKEMSPDRVSSTGSTRAARLS